MKRFSLGVLGILAPILLVELLLRALGGFYLAAQKAGNFAALRKPAIRVVCFGESTTQGQYPRYLEEYLNSGSPEKRFSVIDRGLAGADTGTLVAKLDAELDKFRPDIVVTMIGINDQAWSDPLPGHSPRKDLRIAKLIALACSHPIFHKQQRPRIIEAELYQFERSRAGRSPPSKDAVFFRAQADHYQGLTDWDKAEEAANNALSLDATAGEAYVYLARVHAARGDWSKVEDIYQRALALGPKGDWVHRKLAEHYFFRGKWSKAVDMYLAAVAISPQDGSLNYDLGLVYSKMREMRAAEKSFLRALALNHRHPAVYHALGQLYDSAGKTGKARTIHRMAEHRGTNADEALFVAQMKRMFARPDSGNAGREFRYYYPATVRNYRRIAEEVSGRGLPLVCVQYPMRDIAPLKEMIGSRPSVVFVDNQAAFRQAVEKEGSASVFTDQFGGDFGHCTQKGNRILARNIADVILNEFATLNR